MGTTVRLFKGTFEALSANFREFAKLYGWLAVASYFLFLVSLFSQGATVIFLVAALSAIFCVSASVRWHRVLLVGGASAEPRLQFGRREARYFARMLILAGLGLVVIAPFLMFLLWLQAEWRDAVPGPAAQLASICSAYLVLPALMRCSLVLPSIAVDRPVTLKDAWRESRGLGVPMMLAIIAVDLSFWPINLVLNLLLGGSASTDFPNILFSPQIPAVGPLFDAVSLALLTTILTGGYYIMQERID
ncbi:hypothetical protein H2509_15105 [Stappia sp. F7233]|uniref:Uncharacterized protein n=1 Tax=Stappia albiluteola TaxID=2758565 RepID=A0A839AI88_9HYPH|nr:hypothetical protein [Stappia albiluteola]MBA5778457.1 hypothetical protein [Stappia albiluteola]